MSTIINILRIRQWYKNIVIFLPIIFAIQFTNTSLLVSTFIGFFALCFISSANYIINDIIDRNRDRIHPEKKNRPIASGRVSIANAIILCIIMLFFGFYLGSTLSLMFIVLEISLFILTTLYSLFLKNEPFVDVLIISINFTIRAIAGTYVTINPESILAPAIEIGPWLILCPFFLALFMVLGKRYADLKLLNKDAVKHKPVYKFYNLTNLESYMTMTTTLLIISYSLFSFLSKYQLLLTLPFALYVIFRYYYFIHYKPEIAREPQKIVKDYRIMISGFLWLIFIIIALIT